MKNSNTNNSFLPSKTIKYLLISFAVVTSILLSPRLYAQSLFNLAHIHRMNSAIDTTIYLRALKLVPKNQHFRHQAGLSLALTGHYTQAATTLLPLFQEQKLDTQSATLLITTLVASNQSSEALRIYTKLAMKPTLPSGIAARILNQYVQSDHDISSEVSRNLLVQVFGLNPSIPEFQAFEQQYMAPDFWSTQRGQRICSALSWYAQSLPINIASHYLHRDYVDVTHVASILNTPVSSLRLGDELLTNGSFEQYDAFNDKPLHWEKVFMSQGNPFNRGEFLIGLDSGQSITSDYLLRIDGLWIERLSVHEGSRAGLRHSPINIEGQKPYIISFVYKTEHVNEQSVALWLSYDSQVLFSNYKILPPTHGQWKRVTIIAWNRSDSDATIAPLLASFSEGSVWFDDFSIRELIIDPPVIPQDAIIQIDEVN